MTTIREFSNEVEAGIVLTFLRDNQINCELSDVNANAWVLARNLVPIRLSVEDAQVQQANELLDQFDKAPILPEGASE